MRDVHASTSSTNDEEAITTRNPLEAEEVASTSTRNTSCIRTSAQRHYEHLPICTTQVQALSPHLSAGRNTHRRGSKVLVWGYIGLFFLVGTFIFAGAFHEKLYLAPLQRPNLRSLNAGYYDVHLSLAGTSMTSTGNGYDTSMGTEALCWKGRAARYQSRMLVASNTFNSSSGIPSPFEDFFLLGSTALLPDCSSQQLKVFSPVELSNGEVLRTGQHYNFTIDIATDLSLLMNQENNNKKTEERLWTNAIDPGVSTSVIATVKIILCDVRIAGFCTPFVHERQILMGHPQPAHEGDTHGGTHLDSSPKLLTLEEHSSSNTGLALQTKVTISMSVNHPGEFVAIAAVEMYSQEGTSQIYHRWDIANAFLEYDGGRLLQFKDPPIILVVSPTVELVSYVAIGLASCVLAVLLLATIYYRNSQILKLTQGNFLIVFLVCALVTVASSFLLNPKSDAYCRCSYPILLISLQVMYAITAGRLWRIHAILSPILKHRDSETNDINDSSERNGRRLYMTTWKRWWRLIERLPCVRWIASAKCQPAQMRLKRTIPNWHLSLVIVMCAMPQILIQIASLTLQPQEVAVQYSEDGSMGRSHCGVATDSKETLIIASFVWFVVSLFLLIAVAFYSRKLPSVGVLNETQQIYDTALTSMLLLMLAAGVVLLTSNARTSPEVAYIVWVTVIVWTTLNAAIRIMFPKLIMAYNGETVLVSDLVTEHHRKIREKEESKLQELIAKAHVFQRSVTPLVKDHKLNVESVRMSFVGEEAIDALVESNVVSSRWEGLQLGRLLQRELKLFRPSDGSGLQEFQDDMHLYRFQDFGKATGSSMMPQFSSRQQLRSSMTLSSGRLKEDDDLGGVEMLSRVELKELAEGFKCYVDVRDQKYHMRKYQMCFVASESIDSMMYAGLVKTREEAVNLGLAFQKKLKLFRHVTNEHDFCDEYLFFRYQQVGMPDVEEIDEDEIDEGQGSLPLEASESSMSSSQQSNSVSLMGSVSLRGKQLTQEARHFVDIVTVKKRRYNLRTWPRVFVGEEAVDALVFSGITSTRWEAVQLGRALARDLGLFKHVTGDHAFSDDFLFYRYDNQNVPKDMVWDESKFSDDVSQGSVGSGGTERSQLAEKVEAFRRCADVRDRRYHGVKYNDCFVASEVIDSLVFTGVVKSRQEAVKLGRSLSRELRLFKHVTNDHFFNDDYLFFRFRSTGDLRASFGGSEGTTGSSSDDERRCVELSTKAKAFRACAEVRDRKYRYRNYKKCFIGMDTVDTMISLGLVLTRKDAVILGRQLSRELNLFSHVCDDHDFCDEYLFFSFNDTAKSSVAVVGEDFSRSFRLDTIPNCDAWMANDRGLETVEEVDSGTLSTSDTLTESTLQNSLLQIDAVNVLSDTLRNSTKQSLDPSGGLTASQKNSARELLKMAEDLPFS